MKEAEFYVSQGEKVKCSLCYHNCLIQTGKVGLCRVRKNVSGRLFSLVYGKPAALHNDPIEKKPLFHFNPGSRVLSLGTVSCNFRCHFCINNHLVNSFPDDSEGEFSPEQVIETARREADGIAYTYNEPTIFFEYAYDIAKLAREQGLFNVFVTNGYTQKEPITKISEYLDAVVIDFKTFNSEFYKSHIKADLEKVKRSVKTYKESGVFIELSMVVIPKYTDEKQIREFCEFVKKDAGEDTPVHFIRFVPSYKMVNMPSTKRSFLEKTLQIAEDCGLFNVYIGNVPGHKRESTFCQDCGTLLIKRDIFGVQQYKLTVDNNCLKCGKKQNIYGKYFPPT